MITGGAASQWPVGKVSDHLDRRWMIIAVALMSSAAGIALVMSYGGGLPILLALAALYGAFSLTIYSLCVAHVNDIADYERFVEVASGALLMYGIGATAGPLIASGLMEARDMAMLFAYAATLHLALAVLHLAPDAASAAARRRAPTFFVTMPRTAPMPPSLDPRAEEGAEVVGGEEPVGEGTDAGRPVPTQVRRSRGQRAHS